MAMHEPHTRIIRSKRNSQEPILRQKGHVPSGRVVEVESLDAGVDVVGACALGQDDEVVAVEMDRMVDRDEGLVWDAADLFGGEDEVYVSLGVVLRDDCVFFVEGGVVEIQDRGVGEVEPTRLD